MIRGVLAAACIAALSVGAAAAQTIAMNPDLAKVIEAAKKEKVLTLEQGGQTFGGGLEKRMQAEMRTMFGIPDLEIKFTPGGPMGVVGQKIATEFRANQTSSTDVWTGAAPQVVPLLKLDMFQKVDWVKLLPGRVQAEFVEADGRALRAATGMPGILYNMQKAPDFAKVVNSEDLLKPEYKGKYAVTPFAGGYDVLLSPQVWGEDKTVAYMEKLAANMAGLLPCGGDDRVASGEFLALALDCAGGAQLDEQYKGKLGLHVVSDNAQRRPYYLLVPKHAAHPNMGILFSVYMATPEGQRVSRASWHITLYEFPETDRRKEVEEWEKKGVKFRDITIAWWMQNPNIDTANNKLTRVLRAATK